MYGPCKGYPFVYASEIESVILVQLLLLVSGLIFFHFSILKYLLLTNISEFEHVILKSLELQCFFIVPYMTLNTPFL